MKRDLRYFIYIFMQTKPMRIDCVFIFWGFFSEHTLIPQKLVQGSNIFLESMLSSV